MPSDQLNLFYGLAQRGVLLQSVTVTSYTPGSPLCNPILQTSYRFPSDLSPHIGRSFPSPPPARPKPSSLAGQSLRNAAPLLEAPSVDLWLLTARATAVPLGRLRASAISSSAAYPLEILGCRRSFRSNDAALDRTPLRFVSSYREQGGGAENLILNNFCRSKIPANSRGLPKSPRDYEA
jgi:hypothetical protein